MSGVYIPGMEMPTSCGKCTFGDGYSCYIKGYIVQDEEWETRRVSFCPLVPVPEHGDLIDRDALKPYMLNEHYRYMRVYDAVEVANAPTIIPADPDKEEE